MVQNDGHQSHVDAADRARLKGHRPAVLWFTGLSGAGKSTIARAIEVRLHQDGCHTFLLDGDQVRRRLNADLGFDAQSRHENNRRVAEVAALFADAGLIVIVALISPFRKDREAARATVGAERFIEVFVDTPLDVCEQRDPRGLYRKARRGEIPEFTGIDSPYEPPQSPELRVDTQKVSVDAAAETIYRYLVRTKIL